MAVLASIARLDRAGANAGAGGASTINKKSMVWKLLNLSLAVHLHEQGGGRGRGRGGRCASAVQQEAPCRAGSDGPGGKGLSKGGGAHLTGVDTPWLNWRPVTGLKVVPVAGTRSQVTVGACGSNPSSRLGHITRGQGPRARAGARRG